MEPLKINIGKGYMPDLMPTDIAALGGLKTATNIIRASGYYWPMYGKRDFNNTALSGTPKAGVNVQSSSATQYNFCGTSTKLYAFDGTNMTDISRTGSAYSGTFWNFAVYGDWLLATNYLDAIQVQKDITHGTSGTQFADLTGTTSPSIKAKYMYLHQGHLILGYLNEAGTESVKKIRWSALENVEDWTYDVSTGADFQEFPEIEGAITGIGGVGKEFAVFSENSITPGYFSGGQYVYGFSQAAFKNIGCAFPRTLISIGEACYFWSKKSIWKLSASGLEEIGKAVKNTVFAELNSASMDSMSVVHDASKSLIYWHYPASGSSSSTVPSKLLIYNYAEDVFTTAEVNGYFIMMGYFGETLVDSLTTLIVDSVTDSTRNVDSPYWKGNSVALMVCDDLDYKIKTMNGSLVSGLIETGEIDGGEQVVSITKTQIPVEGSNMVGTLQIQHRYSSVMPQSLTVVAPIRQDSTVDRRVSDRRFSGILRLSNYERMGNTITFDAAPSGGR